MNKNAMNKNEEVKEKNQIVNEWCSFCEVESGILWNVETMGYHAYCPYCGKRLMLCSMCDGTEKGVCDYESDSDSCKHTRKLFVIKIFIFNEQTKDEYTITEHGDKLEDMSLKKDFFGTVLHKLKEKKFPTGALTVEMTVTKNGEYYDKDEDTVVVKDDYSFLTWIS